MNESKACCAYNTNIPFQYRVIANLLRDNDYNTVKRILEANEYAFQDEYNYLILDFAIEKSTNIVVTETGEKIVDYRPDKLKGLYL